MGNGGQGIWEGGADDDTQVRNIFCHIGTTLGGGAQIGAFGGTCGAVHATRHVDAVPQPIALLAHDICITY